MNEFLNMLLAELERKDSPSSDQREQQKKLLGEIEKLDDQQFDFLLAELLRREFPASEAARQLLGEVLQQIVRNRLIRRRESRQVEMIDDAAKRITLMYKHLRGFEGGRFYLLQLLVASGAREALAAFADLIVEDPLSDPTRIAVVFGPLFQRTDYDAAALFPRLLEGLSHRSAAALILDLANYMFRQNMLKQHPASGRSSELIVLMGELAQRLGRVQERSEKEGEPKRQVVEKVADSIALAVSLCDAVALIEDQSAISKLYQLMELGHRRLRTEAAAALARLGEQQGEEVLAEMAADPVSRLYAIAFSEELGLLDRVEGKYQTPEARAESELVLWLAQPTQMGFPPSQCELIDQRSLYWPGFDELVDCFLFRFTYQFGETLVSNIGISGPLAFAFAVDLCDMSPEDIYAAFAGWHAEHEDIYEIDVSDMSPEAATEAAGLQRQLLDAGYQEIEPVLFGFFLGGKTLIARAKRDGGAGIAIADLQDVFWLPTGVNRRPLGPSEAYCVYKGRKLLRTFNT